MSYSMQNKGNVEMGDMGSSQVALTNISYGSKSSKAKTALIILVVVLFIVAGVFIGLYIYEKQYAKQDGDQTSKTSKSTETSNELCSTEGCVLASSSMLQAMNKSVDPCDDFYEYACGNWVQKNAIPDSKTSWSQFKILNDKNEELLRQIIQDKSLRLKYGKNEAAKKAFDFYDACMNTAEIESLGAKPLLDLIAKYGSWNVTDKNFSVANWDFMDTFVKVQKELGMAPLFNMFVATDLKESTKNVIVFDQSGLGMSKDSYFANTSFYIKYRESYKTLMVDLMDALGAVDAQARADEVYAFEESLAKAFGASSQKNSFDLFIQPYPTRIFMPKELRRDSSNLYNKLKLGELAKIVGNDINITKFAEMVFEGTGYTISEDEDILIYALDYMKNFFTIFKQTEKRIIANYIMWHVVETYSTLLSNKFVALFDRHRERSFGTSGKDPLWQRCMGSVQDAFGMAIGLMFVEKKFSGESKKSAEDMIHAIRKVFINNLKDIDWMDDETKKAAEDKANAIRENIGYPDYISNATALADRYKGLVVTNKTHFQNTYNKRKFRNMQNYLEIKKPADKTEWSMIPQTVNAYYSSTNNKIVFPAGILQDPFYDQSHPKSLNYGGIGMVVGHEISHGFDDNGRRFNKDGNLRKWWTNSSISSFVEKTKCLVNQYSQYKFHGKQLNGEQTLGENIADNGGIKQAFQAYQLWKKENGEEKKLPGLDLSHDQLFFLSFAQIWCSSFRLAGAISALENGVHSPGKFRVIGSLSNSKEFAQAYKCPAGSKMNPTKKCEVW